METLHDLPYPDGLYAQNSKGTVQEQTLISAGGCLVSPQHENQTMLGTKLYYEFFPPQIM